MTDFIINFITNIYNIWGINLSKLYLNPYSNFYLQKDFKEHPFLFDPELLRILLVDLKNIAVTYSTENNMEIIINMDQFGYDYIYNYFTSLDEDLLKDMNSHFTNDYYNFYKKKEYSYHTPSSLYEEFSFNNYIYNPSIINRFSNSNGFNKLSPKWFLFERKIPSNFTPQDPMEFFLKKKLKISNFNTQETQDLFAKKLEPLSDFHYFHNLFSYLEVFEVIKNNPQILTFQKVFQWEIKNYIAYIPSLSTVDFLIHNHKLNYIGFEEEELPIYDQIIVDSMNRRRKILMDVNYKFYYLVLALLKNEDISLPNKFLFNFPKYNRMVMTHQNFLYNEKVPQDFLRFRYIPNKIYTYKGLSSYFDELFLKKIIKPKINSFYFSKAKVNSNMFMDLKLQFTKDEAASNTIEDNDMVHGNKNIYSPYNYKIVVGITHGAIYLALSCLSLFFLGLYNLYKSNYEFYGIFFKKNFSRWI